MAFNKAEQYGESENILESAVGLVTKTKQATKSMAGSDGVIKAGALFEESEDAYTAVTATTGKNPKTEGWYELTGGKYAKTSDTEPAEGKTYYTKSTSDTFIGVVFEDYDMSDYAEFPIAVAVQGRLKADKVSASALAKKEAFAKQGLYLV